MMTYTAGFILTRDKYEIRYHARYRGTYLNLLHWNKYVLLLDLEGMSS